MKVALLDSGIDIKHNYFINSKIECVDLFNDGDVYDQNGHGTLSAGEILHANPKAEIVSIKILNQYNSGNLCNLAKALEYCIERKDINIINMSLTCQINDYEVEASIEKLIKKLNKTKALILCSEPNYSNKNRYLHQINNIFSICGEYSSKIEEYIIDYEEEKITYYGDNFLRPFIRNEYKLFRGNSSYTARMAGQASKKIDNNTKQRLIINLDSNNKFTEINIYEKYRGDKYLLDLLLNPLSFLNSVQDYGFIYTIQKFGINILNGYPYTNISLDELKNPPCVINSILEYNMKKT